MNMAERVIEGKGLKKKYKGFELNIPDFQIPKGFATALIGENGAGKSTLLRILAGTRLDYEGKLIFFGKYSEKDREKADNPVRENTGYTGPGNYYLPHWTVGQAKEMNQLLFEHFDSEKFDRFLKELQIVEEGFSSATRYNSKISELSDGNKMKLMLAGVFSRKTDLLILDEPASPLDPLMRDVLCDMIRDYIEKGEGEKSVLFSTHNIADMENITDYAIIMEHGRIVEQGFTEDLKEKYIAVKGEIKDADQAEKVLYSFSKNSYGFEGICLSKDLDRLAGMDIALETPTLSQICVAVMRVNSSIRVPEIQEV